MTDPTTAQMEPSFGEALIHFDHILGGLEYHVDYILDHWDDSIM